MGFFVNLGFISNNKGSGGSFSMEMPTSSLRWWSRAHSDCSSGRGVIKTSVRAREGGGGWSWVPSNECQRQQGSSPDKPTFKQFKRISKGITTAFGAFQGWKVVQKLGAVSLEEDVLVGLGGGNWMLLSVKATRIFAKGLKVSQKVLTSATFSKHIFKGLPAGTGIEKIVYKDLGSLAVGFNAFYAAIKIVQYTKDLGGQPPGTKLPDDSIWKGYKFSKSLLTVLDPVIGKIGWSFTHVGKMFLGLKTVVGGIGVVVKAALLCKELSNVLLHKLSLSGGDCAASSGTGFERQYIWMVVSRHQSKKLLPLRIAIEEDICNLLSGSFPFCSLSKNSLFSSTHLFDYNVGDTGLPYNQFHEDDLQFIVFCLSIPLPSADIPVCA